MNPLASGTSQYSIIGEFQGQERLSLKKKSSKKKTEHIRRRHPSMASGLHMYTQIPTHIYPHTENNCVKHSNTFK